MKKQFTWFGVLAAIIIGISTFFVGCNKDDLNEVVAYKGQVVYINTTIPFADLTVKVTNGKDTHCQTQTDAGGFFSLKVRVSEIDGDYYLLAGDSTCIPKKVGLGGYGQAEVDLGVIEVEGPALPTVKTSPIREENITADEAIISGEVLTDGRMRVTARGICYGKDPYPTVEGLHTTEGSGLGEFTSTLKNLEFNTIYYARAYATNQKGTAYGDQVKFTTELGVPIVITDSVYRITVHTARCKGHVENDGGYKVTQRGTCWSLYPDPTLDDDFTNDGSDVGEFTSALSGLQENTKYYVRTYATNSTTTSYGEQITITTLDGLATVNTTNFTTTATSMVINCEVTDDAGYSVSERGICYSTINSEPSIEDSKKANGKGKGSYSVSVSELSASTTYYVRAYAINEYGIAYSSELDVITLDGAASISIISIDNITALSASGNIKVTDSDGGALQSCGLCWSTNPNPTITDNGIEASGKQLNTIYSCNMSELKPNTTYYVRGYATTDIMTAYSEPITFTTKDGLPTITTGTTTATSNNIVSGGTISSDGGYSITARGVCYSINNSSPTLADNFTTAGIGTGTFSSTITGVSVNTTYYVRAYATNIIGTSYGTVISITTGDGLPTVATTDIGENVTDSTIISGGQVISDGGYAILQRGVCWNTLPYPTISDNYTNDGSGLGYFSSTIKNVKPLQNEYYVRAYATNENGTTYGEQYMITPEVAQYTQLKEFTMGGYTYKIIPLGVMNWADADNVCQNLTYAGYSDWFLPNQSEGLAILTAYGQNLTWETSVVSALKISGYDRFWTVEKISTNNRGDYTLIYVRTGTGNKPVYRWGYSNQPATYQAGVLGIRKF